MTSVEDRLLLIVRAHVRQADIDAVISQDTPLADLGLDSLRAIDLLFQVEEHFGITFPDRLLNEATFRTRRALQAAVEAVLTAGS